MHRLAAALVAAFLCLVSGGATAGDTLFIIGLPDGRTAISVRDMPPGFVLCMWTYGSEFVQCLRKTGLTVEDDDGISWAFVVEGKEFPMPEEPEGG